MFTPATLLRALDAGFATAGLPLKAHWESAADIATDNSIDILDASGRKLPLSLQVGDTYVLINEYAPEDTPDEDFWMRSHAILEAPTPETVAERYLEIARRLKLA